MSRPITKFSYGDDVNMIAAYGSLKQGQRLFIRNTYRRK